MDDNRAEAQISSDKDSVKTCKSDKKTETFANFIRERLKEYNDDTGKELSIIDLGKLLNVKASMINKRLNKQKPIRERDFIIALCVLLQVSPGETDEALCLYNMSPLNPKDDRDCFITSQISSASMNKTYDLTLNRLNWGLTNMGYKPLNISCSSKVQCNNSRNEKRVTRPYNIVKTMIRPLESIELYFDDPYHSLCTKYDPFQLTCYGDMLLFDPKQKKNIHLVASSSDYLSSKIIKEDILPTIYGDIDETDDFKEYFCELKDSLILERQKLLEIVKDTKNYQLRSSARVINDSLCVFVEEFNYTIPEINEYFVLCRSEGKYEFKVYTSSSFMQYYLSTEKFRKLYNHAEADAKETYSSIEQIDSLMHNYEKTSVEYLRLRLRRIEFVKLKQFIDNLFQKIEKEEVFIQNINDIYDNPMDVLRYYKIEEDYECKYDEYGEIINSLKERVYLLEDGRDVNIRLEDLYDAFKLGIESIDDVCRLKANNGLIKNLIR